MSGANGAEPLSWQELRAWQECTGADATPEEMLLLRQLSMYYVDEMHKGEDPASPNPAPMLASGKQDVAAEMKGLLRSRKKS